MKTLDQRRGYSINASNYCYCSAGKRTEIGYAAGHENVVHDIQVTVEIPKRKTKRAL